MKRILSIVLLIVFLLMVVSCAQNQVEETEDDWVIPKAGETTGIVQGVLLNVSTDKPVRGILYLSRNLSYKDLDMPATISFSLQSDPRGTLNDQTGEFYFKDIEPGENYVIVLHYGPGSFIILQDKTTEYPIMVEVDAGKVNDLGTFDVDEP